jgi:D-sedoheptulose 7-phosphate isomerase
MMEERIKRELTEALLVTKELLSNHIDDIAKLSQLIIEAYKKGGKIVMFGNGGSAADSQHIVGELVNYLYMPGRPMLNGLALTTNSSTVTAIGNDIGYENLFKRQVESLVTSNDVVIGISTSGNSKNVILGLEAARSNGATLIAWTGKTGGKMANYKYDMTIKVPSTDVARIQEGHMKIGHIMCSIVEKELFQEKRFT